MRFSAMESLTLALLTATITAGILNGVLPGFSGSCKEPHPFSGLPEELVTSCEGWAASVSCGSRVRNMVHVLVSSSFPFLPPPPPFGGKQCPLPTECPHQCHLSPPP